MERWEGESMGIHGDNNDTCEKEQVWKCIRGSVWKRMEKYEDWRLAGIEYGWILQGKKKERGVLCPNIITLEISICMDWPLIYLVESCSKNLTYSNRYQCVYVPWLWYSYFKYTSITCGIKSVLVVLLVAQVMLRFTESKTSKCGFFRNK